MKHCLTRWRRVAAAAVILGQVTGAFGCNSLKEEAPSSRIDEGAQHTRARGESEPNAPTATAAPSEGRGDSNDPASPSPVGKPSDQGGRAGVAEAPATRMKGEQGHMGVPGSPPPPAKKGPGSGGEVGALAADAEMAIDPNGRFATTYRPGGGHLAAFESAIARGIVPAAEREVVSDIGARYAPEMAAPKGKALAIRTDLERAKLSPGGGPFHVRLSLQSTEAAPAARPHLSVHLVLDVSGSMAGESIVQAREASRALVDKLAPTDDFSLVTFSSDAQVLVPDGPVGARRNAIKNTISGIKEGGGTNIGAGLTLGYQQAAAKGIPEDAVRVVLLLSDGRANSGITSSERLSKIALDAFQQGVQTSSFGLGADFDGPLMSAIAGDGAGGYYYLRDPAQIAPALATELDKRLDPVATAVEVRVRLKPGVELLRVYGSRRLTEAESSRVRAIEVASDKQAAKRDKIQKDREDDNQGGMRFFMPAFARNDSHALLLKLKVPEGVGSRPVAFIELKYKDRVAKKNVSDELPLKVDYADSDAASAASADSSVARTIHGFAAGDSLAEAASRIGRGDRNGAAALLSEREGILRQAAETLKEPLFLKDADRLARLRGHTGVQTGMGDSLVLAMMMEAAASSHLR